MSLEGLLTETVTVVRYGSTTDEYGSVVRGVTATTTWSGRLEQLATDEILRDRDTIIADWRAWLPAAAEVGPYDVIEARGFRFEVVGLPNRWATPAGPHHIELTLRYAA